MAQFRKKPVVIEAITFDEFVEYGKNNGGNIVNGMPWSFDYKGQAITHENDECYLIPTLEGSMKFTPQDMLITGVNGEIYPCKIEIFEKTYDVVREDQSTESNTINRLFDSGYSITWGLAACKYCLDYYPQNSDGASDAFAAFNDTISMRLYNLEKGWDPFDIEDDKRFAGYFNYTGTIIRLLNAGFFINRKYVQKAFNIALVELKAIQSPSDKNKGRIIWQDAGEALPHLKEVVAVLSVLLEHPNYGYKSHNNCKTNDRIYAPQGILSDIGVMIQHRALFELEVDKKLQTL